MTRHTGPLVVREPYPMFRFEWLLVAGVVAAGGLLVAYWSRDAWFYSDVWDFLAMRRFSDLGSLFRPHRGNLQLPAALQTGVLYSAFGMEFWPFHYLPRALGWGAVSGLSWWIMRRRGAHPAIALGAVAVITVLGSSYYFQAAHIGALIGISCALGAAYLIDLREEPSNTDRLAVFALLAVGVMSAGIGVSAFLGIVLGLLIVRRLSRWIVPVIAAGAVYGGWVLSAGVLGEDATQAVRTPFEIPWAIVQNLKNIILEATQFPDALGWPLVVAALAGFVWLVWRRKIAVFDVLVLSSALVYVVLISRTRANVERGPVATNVILLLIPVFVPYVSLVRRQAVVLAGLVMALLVAAHAVRLQSGLDERIGEITAGRPAIESMAALIAQGEFYESGMKLTEVSSSSQLTVGGLARLVDEGWEPGPPTEPSAIIRLRVSFTDEAEEGDAVIMVAPDTLREDGCMVGFPGAPIVLDVAGLAVLRAKASQPTDIVVGYSAAGRQVSATISRARTNDRTFSISGPQDGTTITLEPVEPDTKLRLCGVGDFVRP